MKTLAKSFKPDQLAQEAFRLWILAAKNDRQELIPVAIGPSNIQGCCTHNLYRHQDTNGGELFHFIFAMFGNEPACSRTTIDTRA